MTTQSKATPLVWIRSIIFYCFFLITIPITAIAMGLLPKISFLKPWDPFRWWGKFVNFLLRTVCGVKFEVTGIENINPEPRLLVSNHTGPWETLALSGLFPNNFYFSYILKKNLLSWKYNFLALGIYFSWPIPISRDSNQGDFKVMVEESKKRFEKGVSVLVFPQGTRCPTEESLEMGAGGALLAKKLNCSYQSIFLSSEPWSRGKWIKDFGLIYPGTIKVNITPNVSKDVVKTSKAKVLHQQTLDFYAKSLDSLST